MIKIHKSKNGQYYFTVHAKNGAVLVTSEMYTRKSSAWKGVQALDMVMISQEFSWNIKEHQNSPALSE